MSGEPNELPFERPGKVICFGLNYREHADESPHEAPSAPLLFAKWPSSLIGPGQPIPLPAADVAAEIDYEAELGVVIGTRASNLAVAEALAAVAGYCCVNDVSARDVQRADGQWTRAKSFDGFGPVGPLVPSAEIADPQSLAIACRVNGETLQEANTSQMIFPIAELIAFASRATTLEPGDLIATGTPGGIGARRNPPRFLQPGDVVEVEIESVGLLSNPVEKGS